MQRKLDFDRRCELVRLHALFQELTARGEQTRVNTNAAPKALKEGGRIAEVPPNSLELVS